MNKNNNILIIGSIILILLINIVYSIKSSFGENLKLPSTGSVVINFLGFGKDPNNATLDTVLFDSCQSTAFGGCPYPNSSQDYNLIHVNGSTINNYLLAKSNISGSTGFDWNCGCEMGYSYVNYTNVQTLPAIQVNDGDILFTNDITGITSYKIQYGTVADPSGINVDYSSNIITVDISKGPTQFNAQYVHNLVNNNGLPPGSILFQFPDNTGSGCACTKITELSNAGNQIYNSGGNCTEGNNILISPGQYGYDINKPQFKCLLYMSNLGGCELTNSGSQVDAGPWINQAINDGYRKFIIQEPDIGFCFYGIWGNDKYASKFIATNNINGSGDRDSGNLSSMSC